MNKLADFTIRYRWMIILVFLLISALLASQIKKAELNPDMLTYMPEDMPSRVQQAKIEDIFGGTEMIVIIVEHDDIISSPTLKRVKRLSDKMKRLKGVDKVMSLFETKQVRNQDGAMMVDPAVRLLPRSAKDVEKIKTELSENELVYGSVISEDFKTTTIIGLLEPDVSEKYIIGEVNNMLAQSEGPEKVYLGGPPYTRSNVSSNMMKDFVRLLPLGLLLMLIFLYFCFKQFRGVWIPFLVVLVSIFAAMGLLPMLGWKITAITILLPILLIAVANDYGIHMIAKWQEDFRRDEKLSRADLIKNMLSSLGTPIVLAGITTIAGLLCLLGHILIPAEQIGILAGIGIAVALIASLVLIPALIAVLPTPKRKSYTKKAKSSNQLHKFLTAIGAGVAKHPKRVITISSFVTLCGIVGLTLIVVNTDPIKYFADDHPVVSSADKLNSDLGGYFPLSIVFKGDIKEPELMKKIDRIEKEVKNIPTVGATTSIAKVMRQISRAINDPEDDLYDRIPDTYNAVAQYLELYLMSGDPDDLEKMIDFNFEHAMLLLRFTSTSTPKLREGIAEIQKIVGDDADVQYIGGNSAVFSELDLCVVNGQLLSLVCAIALVFILLMIVFRSLMAAVISTVPLLFSIVVLFGIMGFSRIDLNIVTALLSSIMIGVGIDYTIHYIWKYRSLRLRGESLKDATVITLQTTGRGILFNALSVIIGFSALLFSSFMPVKFFGVLVIITISACLLASLVIIPALCIIIRPRFLEPAKLAITQSEKPLVLIEEEELV
ncbi:efflux RND transporter permease subunit [Marinifilum sp.]|uniref:efflux RND transporter permease subunit n=1 Tax=Marinifilum sp. TaxID=2033137 RepID=UPI003BAC5602